MEAELRTVKQLSFKQVSWTGDIVALLWKDVVEIAEKNSVSVVKAKTDAAQKISGKPWHIEVTGQRTCVASFTSDFRALEAVKKKAFSEAKVWDGRIFLW